VSLGIFSHLLRGYGRFLEGNGSVSGIFIPLWQRGIIGDFTNMFGKSPLPPLFQRGVQDSFILFETVTEGLPNKGNNGILERWKKGSGRSGESSLTGNI